MKIGICLRTWDEKGGIGAYTRNLMQAMLSMDSKNQYVLFYNNKAHVGLFNRYESVKERFVPAYGKVMWDQVASPWYAQKEDVDVIFHTKLTVPLLTRKKTVMVLHGTERFFFPKAHPKTDRLYFRTIYPQYLKKASVIIADSERARQDVINLLGIDPKKIKTVHLAGDPAFHLIKDEVFLNNIRNKYRLPERFIIYVGHVYPGKNVGRLFKAFKQVREHHDIKLVMVGALRWKFQDDLNLIKTLHIEDHIQMLGYVPLEDLVGLYNLAELTAFPSLYECFPAIPLDANACGCPVVTSHTGGTPEAAGDAAVYVNPMDVDGIAKAISTVLEDAALRKDLIDKGFRNAKRFSWQKTAQATLAAIESLGSA